MAVAAHGASRAGRGGLLHLGHTVTLHPGRMSVEAGGDLSVDFFPMPNSPQILGSQGVGVLDLGNVSYSGASEYAGVQVHREARSFSVQTMVGLRIGKSDLNGGTAVVKAWLDAPADPYQVYFDNVQLGLQPTCVSTQTQVGILTRHELKIRVPSNTSDKQARLQAQISVQVVRN